jgi:hypothetical protein
MAKKKETRKLTIEFEPDVREVIEEMQQQRGLLSFKDAVQAIIRDWKRKTQKSIAQSMDEEPTLNKSSLPTSDAESDEVFSNEEEPSENNYFNCNKLCKKARTCTSNAMNDLSEINARTCYTSKFPYYFVPKEGKNAGSFIRICKFMKFKRDMSDDPTDPYPECIAKQTDVPIQLPKDRIMNDPQVCWDCYKIQKQKRNEEYQKKQWKQRRYTREPNPYTNFTMPPNSEGYEPDYHEGYR